MGSVPRRGSLKRPGGRGRVAGEEPRRGGWLRRGGEPGAWRPVGSGPGDSPRADRTAGGAEQVTGRDAQVAAASPTSGCGGAEAEAGGEARQAHPWVRPGRRGKPRGQKRGVPK